MKRVGILGAGTWGTALAHMLCANGHQVTMWSALKEELKQMAETHKHKNLPGLTLEEAIVLTTDMSEVCLNQDILVFAMPSVYVRSSAKAASPYIPDSQIVVDVSKGIEPDTLLTMSEVIEDELKKNNPGKTYRMVALSGPTHAEEVAIDLPSTIVSASADPEVAKLVQDVFMNNNMRVYTNDDRKGVELCGAMKNIVALASGISSGLGYGDNAKAALITRGIAEIKRLGLAMGCDENTFNGLAGIGDLIVTAMSIHSRNNRCGYLIGQGKTKEEAIAEVGMVVEGINAIPAAKQLSKKYQVEMPLVLAVDAVVNQGADPRITVNRLMGREKKSEF